MNIEKSYFYVKKVILEKQQWGIFTSQSNNFIWFNFIVNGNVFSPLLIVIFKQNFLLFSCFCG